jgi:aspartate kinase
MPVIEEGDIPVLGGFISSTLEGTTTTLGRGGSDYTATLVGAALYASEVQIWTDVTGVLTADPAIVGKAHTIPHLSYREAAEIAFFGAKVLHPKTVRPAAEASIPIRILNSRLPAEPGTYICSWSIKPPEVVKVITHKPGLTMLHVTSSQTNGNDEFHQAILNVHHASQGCVSIVASSVMSVSLTLNEPHLLPGLIKQLERLGTVKVEPKRALIGAVGEGLRTTLGVASRAFSVLADVCPFFISHGESGSNLSFLIAEERANEVVRRLHNIFFGECATATRAL